MKINRREFLSASAAGSAVLLIGPLALASEPAVSSLLAKAEEQIMQADNRERLLQLISTYEKVLAIDARNYEALWSLGRYCGLVGMAYARDLKDKEFWYSTAFDYCERGLRTNPEFDALLKKGEKVWRACRVTTAREIAALFYWNTCRAAIWMQCSNPLEQILGLNVLPTSKKIMHRMMEIDPEWAGGHPYYAWALFYTALPRALGGNINKAGCYYDKAIEAGPNWLYIKHGRAEYYHTKRKDRQGFIGDLEWVLAQEPKTADSPYPANVHFQRTAREMLDNIDRYF